jgi:hypothetical protein
MSGYRGGASGRGGHHGRGSSRAWFDAGVYRRAFGSLMDRGATVTPTYEVFPGNVVGGLYLADNAFRGGGGPRIGNNSSSRGRWTFPLSSRYSRSSGGYAYGWARTAHDSNFVRSSTVRGGSVSARQYYDRRELVAITASESGRGYPFPVGAQTSDDLAYQVDVHLSDGRRFVIPDLHAPGHAVPNGFGPVRSRFAFAHRSLSTERTSRVALYFSRMSHAANHSGISYPQPVSAYTCGTNFAYPGHILVFMSDGTAYQVPDFDEFSTRDSFPPSLGPVGISWTRGTRDDPHVVD